MAMHTHIYTNTLTEIHTCTHTHIQIHAHVHSYTHAHSHTHSSTNTCSHTLTHSLTCKHTLIHTHSFTLTHSCTRTFSSSPHNLVLLACLPPTFAHQNITSVSLPLGLGDRAHLSKESAGTRAGDSVPFCSLWEAHMEARVFHVNPKARTISEFKASPYAGHMWVSVLDPGPGPPSLRTTENHRVDWLCL